MPVAGAEADQPFPALEPYRRDTTDTTDTTAVTAVCVRLIESWSDNRCQAFLGKRFRFATLDDLYYWMRCFRKARVQACCPQDAKQQLRYTTRTGRASVMHDEG